VKPALRRALRWTRWGLLGLALVALAGFVAVASAVSFWDYDPVKLEAGEPLVLTDRRGEVIRRVPRPGGRPGREAWVPLAEIPPLVVSIFLVSEDAGFYEHGGLDWRGVARAAWLNVRERRLGYGGSTITQQLVRMIHSPGEPRTFTNKIGEAILAMRLERSLTKDEILEHYLNRAYFGNGAHGIEAAARLYFDKPARALSAGEATLVAVIPRAPTAYDPIRRLEAALARREHVFGLLEEAGIATAAEIDRARRQTPAPRLHQSGWIARHFTDHVLDELPAAVRRAGGVVETTLDLELQRRLEREVAAHVAERAGDNLDQAGLVVLDTATGEVLAMVGSAGWDTEGGEINIVTRRRHPGSALKPFIYALAIEAGDSPATLAYDIRDVPSAYEVTQLTQPERGPVRYREALAGSYNLAAIHTLERVGLESAIGALRRAGVGPFEADAREYGLRLALGSPRVRLLDLAAGYGFLARGGRVIPARSIAGVRGRSASWQPPRSREVAVVSPETAWLVADILSDPAARRPAFGDELPVDLPFPVAVKTGTSRGFSDTVTVGVTEQVTVAAWGGNFDGVPTHGLIAMEASAPLVRAGLFAVAQRAGPLTLPPRPEGIETIAVCPLSGARPGAECPHRRLEHVAAGAAPRTTCEWHQPGGAIQVPPEIEQWARRERQRGGRHLSSL
jgi:penicillin-binding protein 1C